VRADAARWRGSTLPAGPRNAAAGEPRRPRSTAGHLFLTADGAWVPAGELRDEDELVDADGNPVTIAAVEHRSVDATVHNLTVDVDHTYTVVTTAGTDVVTHNESPDDLRGGLGDAQDAHACPVSGSSGGATPGWLAQRFGETPNATVRDLQGFFL
jgi:hypothetical protein